MAAERIIRHPSTRSPEPSHVLIHSPMVRVEKDGKKILANPKHNQIKVENTNSKNPDGQEKSI